MAKKTDNRFVRVHQEMIQLAQGCTILMDRVTGVQYLFTTAGYSGGLTVLVDQEGKPLLYQPPQPPAS